MEGFRNNPFTILGSRRPKLVEKRDQTTHLLPYHTYIHNNDLTL